MQTPQTMSPVKVCPGAPRKKPQKRVIRTHEDEEDAQEILAHMIVSLLEDDDECVRCLIDDFSTCNN